MAERTARTHVSNILAKLGPDQPDAGRPVRRRAPRSTACRDHRRRAARRAGHRLRPRHAPDRRDVGRPAGRPAPTSSGRSPSTCPAHGSARGRAVHPGRRRGRRRRRRSASEAGGRAVVVGLSLGGYVAMALAAREPGARPRARAVGRDGRAGRGPDAAVPGPGRASWTASTRTPRRGSTRGSSGAATRRRSPSRSSPAGSGRAAARRRCGRSCGERFVPRLARLPGPDADHQRRARPPVPALRPDVRARPAHDVRRVRLAGARHLANLDRPAAFTEAVRRFARSLDARPDRRPRSGGRLEDPRLYWPDPPQPDVLRFDARSKGRLPRRRLGHPLPAGHQGAAQGDAAAGRQADHPVRGRGGRRGRDRAGHHRHLQPEAGDRGPLRPLLRARAPARGEGRHRDAPAGPRDQRPRPGRLRPPEGAARPRPRGADGQGPHRPRAVRGDPARRRRRRAIGRASASSSTPTTRRTARSSRSWRSRPRRPSRYGIIASEPSEDPLDHGRLHRDHRARREAGARRRRRRTWRSSAATC